MSESVQDVKITGGTMFIGLLVFLLLLAVWDIRADVREIRKQLPAEAVQTEKAQEPAPPEEK